VGGGRIVNREVEYEEINVRICEVTKHIIFFHDLPKYAVRKYIIYSVTYHKKEDSPNRDIPATANNDVPCAACWDIPSLDVMSGIMTNPPPIPARDPKVPAIDPKKNAFGNSFFIADDFVFVDLLERGLVFDSLWLHRMDLVVK